MIARRVMTYMDNDDRDKATLTEGSGASHSSSASMWDLLQNLGFVRNENDDDKLHFDFGTLQLEALRCYGRFFHPVINIGGVFNTGRTLGLIEYDLPTEVASREQGLAFISYVLRDQFRDLTIQPEWLNEGLTYQHLLPWMQQAAADQVRREEERAIYDARPHCNVERAWAKLGLKTLRAKLLNLADDAPVEFSFGDGVVTIRLSDTVIAMPADGTPWTNTYSIKAGAMRQLPVRLMQAMVDISIWKASLIIGTQRYSGVVVVEPDKSVIGIHSLPR